MTTRAERAFESKRFCIYSLTGYYYNLVRICSSIHRTVGLHGGPNTNTA